MGRRDDELEGFGLVLGTTPRASVAGTCQSPRSRLATLIERYIRPLRRWSAIGPKMARLRREHHRLLGNGYCTRPPELDCAFESICETCTFFQTSIEFRPTL